MMHLSIAFSFEHLCGDTNGNGMSIGYYCGQIAVNIRPVVCKCCLRKFTKHLIKMNNDA